MKVWYSKEKEYADNPYPLFAPINAIGADAHDLYAYMQDNAPEMKGEPVSWNFGKFLLDGKGKVIGYWRPQTPPNEMREAIMELLK